MGSALLLTRSNLVWAAVGSGVFGLALMTKESVVLVSPFVFGVALVSTVGSDTGGSLVGVGQIRRGAARILLILAASLQVVFLVNPSHFLCYSLWVITQAPVSFSAYSPNVRARGLDSGANP